jgi:hypothetical protein
MITIKKSEFKKLFDLSCQSWKPKLEEKLKEFIFEENIKFKEDFIEEMKKACTKEQLVVFNKIFKDYLPKDISEEVNNINSLESRIKDFKTPYKLNTKDKLEKTLNAIYILTHVATIYNEGAILDWKNTSVYKYLPYKFFSGGSACVAPAVLWGSGLGSSAGLYYKNSNLSEKSYNNFKQYWEDLWGF